MNLQHYAESLGLKVIRVWGNQIRGGLWEDFRGVRAVLVERVDGQQLKADQSYQLDRFAAKAINPPMPCS